MVRFFGKVIGNKFFIFLGAKREKPEGHNNEIENDIDKWMKEKYEKNNLRFPA